MKGQTNIILERISRFGWWLYVKIAWRKNKRVQVLLDADTRDNLGYYLRTDHTKFKNL